MSIDKISIGLGDRLYFLHNIVPSNPRRYLILSLNTKLIIGPCSDISIKDRSVEKFGSI